MHPLDQQQLRYAQGKAAGTYDEKDFFCAEIRARLLERLALISLKPASILELGSGTGTAAAQLQSTYPDAQLIQLDWSMPMLSVATTNSGSLLCADSHRLPLADASVDMVFSNMMLPGCADPEQVFSEARRVLRAPGVFLFSTLGPDTMKELRRAWAQVDKYAHVHVFIDMHNVGDALVQAGFREPVMDVEMLTVTYADITALVSDLRGIAATNFSQRRSRGLTTPWRWKKMLAALEKSRNPDGRLPTSLEIICGQGWIGEPDVGVGMEDGEVHFPLSRLLAR